MKDDSSIALELGSGELVRYSKEDNKDGHYEEIASVINSVKERNEEAKEENDKVAKLLLQGRLASQRKVVHDIEGIQIATRSTIPFAVGNKYLSELSSLKERADDDQETKVFEETIDIFADFMAYVSLDFKDKEIWIKFEEETGLLTKVALTIFKKLFVSSLPNGALDNFRED